MTPATFTVRLRGLLPVLLLFCAGSIAQTACTVEGEIFGIDRLSGVLMVKIGTGELVSVDPSTNSSEAAYQPPSADIGDRVCVRSTTGGKGQLITITPRRDIEQAERDALATWQTLTVGGSIESTLESGAVLVLRAVAGPPREVATAAATRVWRLTPDAQRTASGATLQPKDLQPGEQVFVQFASPPASRRPVATLIIAGGFETLAAKVVAIDAFSQQFELADQQSGNRFTIHVPASEVYRLDGVSPKYVLRNLDFSDLQPGDWVFLLDQRTPSGRKALGLLVVSRRPKSPLDSNRQLSLALERLISN